MQIPQQRDELDTAARKAKLRLIVATHLCIVVAFFVAAFFWGNFA